MFDDLVAKKPRTSRALQTPVCPLHSPATSSVWASTWSCAKTVIGLDASSGEDLATCRYSDTGGGNARGVTVWDQAPERQPLTACTRTAVHLAPALMCMTECLAR
eukprot:6202153-Pleurochrysis_carterae.AAC.2